MLKDQFWRHIIEMANQINEAEGWYYCTNWGNSFLKGRDWLPQKDPIGLDTMVAPPLCTLLYSDNKA